jgi:hypothetical protein
MSSLSGKKGKRVNVDIAVKETPGRQGKYRADCLKNWRITTVTTLMIRKRRQP